MSYVPRPVPEWSDVIAAKDAEIAALKQQIEEMKRTHVSKTTIPPQALEAGQNNIALMLYGEPYEGLAGAKQDVCKNIAYGAFEAMVTAWPDMEIDDSQYGADFLILPLPTENPDAEA